jgi:capsular exopolysaccharide synthesis family protein
VIVQQAVQTQPVAAPLQNMDLKSAAYMLRRRAKLIGSVAVACMLLALVISMLITPMYKAETLVMLEPRHADVVNIDAVLSPLTASAEVLRSEMDIIQSRAVIDRVIDRLKLMDDQEYNPPAPFWSGINPANWMVSTLTEEEKKSRIRSKIAATLSNHLGVINDGRSYVIHLTFASKNPRKAALIANAFADSYLVDQMETKYEAVARANAWLNDRLGDLKGKVEESERAVEAYREKSNLIELDGGQTVAAKQMEDINQQLSDARGETSQAEAKLHTAQAMLQSPSGVDSATDVLASPLIQNLREQEAALRRNEADLASKYGPLHPKMINAQAQYKELQNKIAEEAHKIVQGLASQVEVARAKENRIARQLDEQESRAGVEMKQSVTLRQLQREADANRGLYESFLNRFKQTSEQGDLQRADSRVIAQAEPPLAAYFPKKPVFMLFGALLGAIFGVIGAYLVEYFDKGFRNSAQVEELSCMPVIGVVPDMRVLTPRAPEDYVADKPMSAYGEALRTVRTAIHFSNVDHPPRVVMVTSSIPGEGKTSFCLSLARTLARTGNRILLIDADMRRSRVASAMGVRKFSGNGLASILSGDKSFAESVQADPQVSGLDIVFAAGKTPNAQDLLASNQMVKLVQEVSGLYDLVIVDTPPILAVSDAAMVARVCDTSIFLIRWATTPRDQALLALKQLANLKCRLAGIVLSQVDLAEQAKYSDSYDHRNYADYYVN